MQGPMDHWQPTPQVTRWTCNTGMIVSLFKSSSNTPTIRNSDILDQDFSWNQIAAALLQMSPRKAPGDDGITTAFLPSGTLYACHTPKKALPPTPFARALVENGDPLNPGDKRGIALINVGLKLVCKVLQMRIERFVETNNLLSYEQAGFRKREECVGQVVSLVDIIQAQTECWAKTPYVLFIDIRKAFDTVPVGALLWKLQNMGIPSSYSCLSQGIVHILICSSSGRLTTIGPIPVPGLSRDTNPIRGLMYADDVAVFADSSSHYWLRRLLSSNGQIGGRCSLVWPRCGIISFTGHLVSRLDNPLDIRLHGQLVSRVESYKYLGVLIDSKLDHSAWLKQKRFALEHTISALYPVLANHQLTVNYRSRIFSAVGHGKSLLWAGAVRLLERSVTKRTPINASVRVQTMHVFTLNVQGAVGKIPSAGSGLVGPNTIHGTRYWLTHKSTKTVKQRHSFALMETLRTCGDSASLQKYVTRQ
ncbi:hypothetical protein BASA81_017224 [Batrachochytrium salamandrivorans]|nr:hypothetical protein BASA81_017224 [Batrachochytrium salamandrivorans]